MDRSFLNIRRLFVTHVFQGMNDRFFEFEAAPNVGSLKIRSNSRARLSCRSFLSVATTDRSTSYRQALSVSRITLLLSGLTVLGSLVSILTA